MSRHNLAGEDRGPVVSWRSIHVWPRSDSFTSKDLAALRVRSGYRKPYIGSGGQKAETKVSQFANGSLRLVNHAIRTGSALS